MTIPSIGGNGNNLSGKINIIKTGGYEQPMPPIPAETPPASVQVEPEEYNISESATAQVKNDVEKEKETESSIEQFKADFENLLNTKVLFEMSQYEQERKTSLLWAVVVAVICIILGIVVFFTVNGRGSGELAVLCFTLSGVFWTMIQKSFEHKVKRKIMPTLMEAVPGFYWRETPPVTEEDIKACKIIPCADVCSKTFDDCFVGEYRNVPIAVSECNCKITRGKTEITILRGVVVRIKMNKNFDGMTVIRPKNTSYNDNFSDLKNAKLEEVKLEDVEFGKMYAVYSTDQIEARYLITTAFMERLKDIESAFISHYAYCSFYGDSVYIAPHSGCDLFTLCRLTKSVTDITQFEVLFYEFVSILALVDHFKLDKKLGL